MSAPHPTYWLAYLSEETEEEVNEITAITPEILDRPRLVRDAQVLLAAADAYHSAHPHERVVLAGAVTRWLHVERDLRWDDLDADFYDALLDLDEHSPALFIEASPVARAIVANAALHLEILVVGPPGPSRDIPTEPVRAAILDALERDWPAYITAALERHRTA